MTTALAIHRPPVASTCRRHAPLRSPTEVSQLGPVPNTVCHAVSTLTRAATAATCNRDVWARMRTGLQNPFVLSNGHCGVADAASAASAPPAVHALAAVEVWV